jgi:RNA polymerase sigma-70 factor (ECF subfamily)
LVGQFRDLGLAEDALQEAWLIAAERWPVSGWPEEPAAWVLTAARRRALDRIRRESVRSSKEAIAAALVADGHDDELMRREQRWQSGVDDDRLRLIFTCCHPVLDVEAQIALTLRSVTWLTTDEIAAAFGVPTPTIAQRIVRAKQRIKDRGVPYRVPSGAELPDRLGGVLLVVYLVFNEAYLSSRTDPPLRVDLAQEAIRLGRQLVELMPDEPEVLGLLALMLAHHARSVARFDAEGDLVVLEQQDRSLWDRSMIDEATRLIESAMRRRTIGRYQLQAAIAAVHSEATTWESTDWPQIAALYGLLAAADRSPVVAVNRAVAVGFAEGADAGLAALADVTPDRLPQRHLLHAARAELLLRGGRPVEAATEFDRALDVVVADSERRHLRRRRAFCDQAPPMS